MNALQYTYNKAECKNLKFYDNSLQIQHTVAQMGKVVRVKRPNGQIFKKGGGNQAFVLIRLNYATIS